MRTPRNVLLTAGLFSVALIFMLAAATLPIMAQESTPMNYGDTVTGQITSAKNIEYFMFDGQDGDVVTITMTRTSGTLSPLVALADPSQPQGSMILAGGDLSSDGKNSTISEFTLPRTGQFAILASRKGVDKGTTTGKYSLTLENTGGGGNETPTDEASPTPTRKPRASSTPRVKATPTEAPTIEPTPDSGGGSTVDGVQSFQVGKMPIFSTWNGQHLFVANYGDGTISILDGEGNVTGTIDAGGVPFAMAWDGSRLWVADLGTISKPSDTVNLFNDAGKKVASYKVGFGPFSLSYDKENKRMWIAINDESKIVAVDSKGKIVISVDTDANPNTVLWTGTQLWATLAGADQMIGNTVIAIDTDGNITGTSTVGKNPSDLAWDDTDQLLFVANYNDDDVMALDADGNVVGTYNIGKEPSAMAWDGSHLWVSLGGENAVAAMSSTGEVLTKITVDAAPNGVTWDGTNIWAAGQGTNDVPGSTITQINVGTVLGAQ